jgi:hypothetical protein
MLRTRFRIAAAVFALPGLVLLVIGLYLMLEIDVGWYIYGIFFVGAVLLLVYSLMLLLVSVGVPSLKIYQKGVLLKHPKGRTRFHPWKEFAGYRMKSMKDMEVIELQFRQGGGESISVHKYVDRYDEVKALVEENLSLDAE